MFMNSYIDISICLEMCGETLEILGIPILLQVKLEKL